MDKSKTLLLKKIPRYCWDSIIEAAKTADPITQFGFAFFKGLQDTFVKIHEEERKKIASALRNVRLEDIENQLNILGIEQKELRENLAKVLQAIAECKELKQGESPTFNTILEAVQKQESIALKTREEILSRVRSDIEKNITPINSKINLILTKPDTFPVEIYTSPIAK